MTYSRITRKPAPPLFTGYDNSIGDIDSSYLLDTTTHKPLISITMDIKITKFRGLSSEDASKFLQDFESQTTLHDVLERPETKHRNRYILLVTDHFMKWVDIFVVLDQTTVNCADYILNEVISWFGWLHDLHSH